MGCRDYFDDFYICYSYSIVFNVESVLGFLSFEIYMEVVVMNLVKVCFSEVSLN